MAKNLEILKKHNGQILEHNKLRPSKLLQCSLTCIPVPKGVSMPGPVP